MPKSKADYPHAVGVRFTPEQFEVLLAEQRPGEKMSDALRRIMQERYDARKSAEPTN